jgi:hypothetical protein
MDVSLCDLYLISGFCRKRIVAQKRMWGVGFSFRDTPRCEVFYGFLVELSAQLDYESSCRNLAEEALDNHILGCSGG